MFFQMGPKRQKWLVVWVCCLFSFKWVNAEVFMPGLLLLDMSTHTPSRESPRWLRKLALTSALSSPSSYRPFWTRPTLLDLPFLFWIFRIAIASSKMFSVALINSSVFFRQNPKLVWKPKKMQVIFKCMMLMKICCFSVTCGQPSVVSLRPVAWDSRMAVVTEQPQPPLLMQEPSKAMLHARCPGCTLGPQVPV